MRLRILLAGAAVALVSMSSGCVWWNNPCWGFRLPQHRCNPGGGACAVPLSAPVSYRTSVGGPVAGPDCHGCAGGAGMVVSGPAAYAPAGYPATSFPGNGYPPVIGSPYPIPGPTVIPSSELPNPMPVKKN